MIGEVTVLVRRVVRPLSSALPNSGGLGDRDRRSLPLNVERTLDTRIVKEITP